MKLRDVAKGTWAIKPIQLRLANAVEAAQPGQPPSAAPVYVTVGARILTGLETADAFEKAQALAKKKGVDKWEATNPLCILYEKACIVALAIVDAESDPKCPESFARSVDELLESQHIGTDNIVYLHERWEDWQDECSIEKKSMTAEEVIAMALKHAESPEGSESPLVRMRPGLRESYSRTLAVLFSSLLDPKSLSGLPTGSSSEGSKKPEASPDGNPSEAGTTEPSIPASE